MSENKKKFEQINECNKKVIIQLISACHLDICHKNSCLDICPRGRYHGGGPISFSGPHFSYNNLYIYYGKM